jgi:type II secretory pathway pseudopilin PulG
MYDSVSRHIVALIIIIITAAIVIASWRGSSNGMAAA